MTTQQKLSLKQQQEYLEKFISEWDNNEKNLSNEDLSKLCDTYNEFLRLHNLPEESADEVLAIVVSKIIYFRYLDGLRKSGVTNMFGASPYLQNAYELDKKEADDILKKWMKTFDENVAVEDRI